MSTLHGSIPPLTKNYLWLKHGTSNTKAQQISSTLLHSMCPITHWCMIIKNVILFIWDHRNLEASRNPIIAQKISLEISCGINMLPNNPNMMTRKPISKKTQKINPILRPCMQASFFPFWFCSFAVKPCTLHRWSATKKTR